MLTKASYFRLFNMNNIYGGVVEQDCLTLHVNQKQVSASDSDVTPSDSNACNLALAIEKSFNNFSALCDQDLQYVGWRMIIASMPTQSSTCNLNVVYFDERICIAEDNSRSTLLCFKDVESVENSCKLDVVELNLPEYIKGLSCTDKSLYFYTDVGSLWTLSNLSIVEPQKILLSNMKVRRVSCGKEHVVILTTLGHVYTFGGGSRGQLGHGDLESLTEPRLVEALSGVFIVDAVAGGWHTLVLSDTGDVYSWGWNESGQVGKPCLKDSHGEPQCGDRVGHSMIMYPSLLFEDNCDITITSISCGSRHSAAVTSDGKLYSWGWNGYGQLLLPKDVIVQDSPNLYTDTNTRFTSVKCGGWSTFVFTNT
ncbi:RCCD1 [Bugula neritina]|uniref:RCCD1 n=1 Tax=Bugula neritina TaxID=10212 RepID=A0A7J7JQK9_BUGNE|nr:RCCD1 [Bugula neritina]